MIMKSGVRILIGVMSILVMASPAVAAGFALVEQSVSGLGNAFAGGAASAEDATTVFFNPAGLTRLKGHQVAGAAHLVLPSTKFKDDGSKVSPLLGGGALMGGDGGDGGETKVVPNFYYAGSLGNGWAVGLGVNSPFGLATDYDDHWQGRYHALNSDLITVNINPSVAYQATEHLSLGAGVSAMYVKAKLSNAVDLGSIAYVQSGLNPGLAPLVQQKDGNVKLDADDWAYGFNLGLLYEFNENSRIGLAYRSRVKVKAKGDANFTLPAAISGIPELDGGIAATFADTDAKADITLPDSASVSLYHRFNPQWAIMADATWTNWSTFDELRVEFDSNDFGITLPDNVTSENWDDSWRFALGATYNPLDKLTLRLGLAYDQTPIPDAEHRTPRIPGEDRYWTALGLGYRFNDRIALDLAYAHLFVKDSKIDKQAGTDPAGEDFFRGTLKGEFKSSVNIVSAQVNVLF